MSDALYINCYVGACKALKLEKAGEIGDSFHISISCCVVIFKKILAPKAKFQTFFYVH